MLRFSLLFAAGVLAFQQLPVIPGPAASVLVLAMPLVAMGFARLRPALLPLAVGFAWSLAHAAITAPAEIDGADGGRVDALAQGLVVSLPQRGGAVSRFEFLLDRLSLQDRTLEGRWRLRVSWRDAPALAPGQRWELRLRIRAVHGFASPGARDYEGHLYHRGIRYRAYVAPGQGSARLLGEAACCWVQRLRDHISQRIDALQVSDFARAVLRAIVVADRSGLSPEHSALFRETGTSHLMAVSGLHIGLLAGIGYLLVATAWRRVGTLCNRVPASIAGTVAGLCAATCYALLAGMQLPTQRALIMLSVLGVVGVSRRRAGASQVLGSALLLVLAWHPPSITEAGFWLSFVAVGMIGVVLLWSGQRARWQQAVAVQFAITIGLWPFLVMFGLPASAVAPLVNLVLVPLFGVLVVPASLLLAALGMLFPQATTIPFAMLATVLDVVGQGLGFVAGLRVGMPSLPVDPVTLALLLLAVTLVLLPPGIPLRPLAAFPLAATLLPTAPSIPVGDFEFRMLDVGQGLSAVIETRRHVLVFDTGPEYASGFATANAVLLPYLRQKTVSRIDLLILSHGDRDHAGGVADVLSAIPVSRLLSGEPERVGFGAGPCRAGQHWTWDGVDFEMLHPHEPGRWQGNDASCVLRVSNAAGSVLLTGDIGKRIEALLLRRQPYRLRSSVVVAPHHGSRSSSSAGFVAASTPHFVAFATGWANRYGFPADEVLARWRLVGAAPLDSSALGTITFRFRRGGVIEGPVAYRRARRRYWSHRDGSAPAPLAVSLVD